MKKTKQKTYQTTVVSEIICDICKQVSRYNNWANQPFEISYTEIYHKYGEEYSDGGSGYQIDVDLCPDCFKNKFIPWLEKEGGCNIEKRKWDNY